jgi:hypothetical protein
MLALEPDTATLRRWILRALGTCSTNTRRPSRTSLCARPPATSRSAPRSTSAATCGLRPSTSSRATRSWRSPRRRSRSPTTRRPCPQSPLGALEPGVGGVDGESRLTQTGVVGSQPDAVRHARATRGVSSLDDRLRRSCRGRVGAARGPGVKRSPGPPAPAWTWRPLAGRLGHRTAPVPDAAPMFER